MEKSQFFFNFSLCCLVLYSCEYRNHNIVDKEIKFEAKIDSTLWKQTIETKGRSEMISIWIDSLNNYSNALKLPSFLSDTCMAVDYTSHGFKPSALTEVFDEVNNKKVLDKIIQSPNPIYIKICGHSVDRKTVRELALDRLDKLNN